MHIQYMTADEVTVDETKYDALSLEWKLQNQNCTIKSAVHFK
jgi:hypothetical protein